MVLARAGGLTHIRRMNLELTDEQTEALIRELSLIIDGDRYPLSPRIVVLKEILGKLRPEPERPVPLPRDGITSGRAGGGMHGDEVRCLMLWRAFDESCEHSPDTNHAMQVTIGGSVASCEDWLALGAEWQLVS
jgi:hypothetical protein